MARKTDHGSIYKSVESPKISVYVFEKDYDKAMLLLNEINASEMKGE